MLCYILSVQKSLSISGQPKNVLPVPVRHIPKGKVQICAELWLIWIKKAGRVCLHSSSQTRYRFTPPLMPPLAPASPVIIPLFPGFWPGWGAVSWWTYMHHSCVATFCGRLSSLIHPFGLIRDLCCHRQNHPPIP